ncbi:hypothetical protein VNI00_014331 [Paramarasmius palmivorus]|uniref:Uncharacterized protein n=1 Tax=Paramarasmius palmivorus TaxID=297713 RepID=A0AAW0BRI6_9AGAR
MYTHDNSSLASVNSEELTWLDAYTRIIQDPSSLNFGAPNSPAGEIPSNPLPYNPSPTSAGDEYSVSRISPTSRRHHYQRSTKSSSAKAVTLPGNSKRASKSLAAKRLNHPNLNCPMTPPPPPLPTQSFSPSTTSLTSTRSDHSSSTPAKRCHSPTSAPPSPRSPEWIYRQPKSSSTPPRKRPDLSRSASNASATSISYFSEVSSGSPLLGLDPDPQESSSTHWTSILKPRKRSGSVKSTTSSLKDKSSINTSTSDIPSLWFGADEGSSSRAKKLASPIQTPRILPKSPSQTSLSFSASGRIQRDRSSSVSSSTSTVSTGSSQPSTPTSPSTLPMIGKKFKPNHMCIMEMDEPEEDKLEGFPGLRRRFGVEPEPAIGLGIPRTAVHLKVDTRPCTSSSSNSNKSVKFVETPTVHYASAGYDPDFWHVPGEGAGSMGIDVDEMDMDKENTKPLSIPHPYAYAKGIEMDVDEDERRDVVKQRIPTPTDYRPEDRDAMCMTPTPERLGGRSLKRLMSNSVKRKPSWRSAPRPSSSPSRSITPRPAISGPFVLGSLPNQPPPPPPKDTRHHPYGDSHGIALRSAPSLESFRSAKSGGAKSVRSTRSTRSMRSLRSLKSIPESVKSGISVSTREMKEWFKGRVAVNAL